MLSGFIRDNHLILELAAISIEGKKSTLISPFSLYPKYSLHNLHKYIFFRALCPTFFNNEIANFSFQNTLIGYINVSYLKLLTIHLIYRPFYSPPCYMLYIQPLFWTLEHNSVFYLTKKLTFHLIGTHTLITIPCRMCICLYFHL